MNRDTRVKKKFIPDSPAHSKNGPAFAVARPGPGHQRTPMPCSSLPPLSRAWLVPLAIAATLAVSPAAAQQGPASEPRPAREHGHQQDDRRALADSVRRVERATRGEVLSAERVPFDGRDVNRVKVVDASGRVRIYMDDPQARREPRPNRTRGNDGNSD